METIYLNAFIYTILTYLLTYLVGHVLISFIKTPERYPLLREFSKMCLGFYSIMTLYAVLRTQGITILSGMLLLFLFLLIWLKKNDKFRTKQEIFREILSLKSLSCIGIQILVLLLCLLYLFLKQKDPFASAAFEVNADLYNYAIVAEHLNKTGVEGGFPDWYSGAVPVRNLYHYGELWYTAFYTFLTRQPAFNIFFFGVFAHCLTICFLGASALAEVFFNASRKKIYAASLSILFICGISFYLPRTNIFTRGDWWDTGLIAQPKYFFTAVFIFYLFIFSKLRKPFPLILIAMAGVLACTVAAPAILISVSLMVAFLFVFRKITFKKAVQWSLPILLTFLFIGAYTFLIHMVNEKNSVIRSLPQHKAPMMPFLLYIKTAFNCFAGQFIKSALSLSPYILLASPLIRKFVKQHPDFRMLLIVFIILHLSSIMAYAVFCFLGVDTVQLWSIIYVPLSAIVCFLAGMIILESNSNLLKAGFLALLVLALMQSRVFTRERQINEEYLSRVRNMYDGSLAVTFISDEFLTRDWSKNINLYPPSPALKMYYKDYNPVCLSVFEVPESADAQFQKAVDEIKHNSVFFRFVQLQKINHEFISVEQSKLDFISRNKVKYIFSFDDAPVPASWKGAILDSARDETGKTTLYRLR